MNAIVIAVDCSVKFVGMTAFIYFNHIFIKNDVLICNEFFLLHILILQ